MNRKFYTGPDDKTKNWFAKRSQTTVTYQTRTANLTDNPIILHQSPNNEILLQMQLMPSRYV